jgi:hypothetical protein
MFDYDSWLESPYTDAESGCDEDCSICWTDCEACEGKGSLEEISCPDCSGEGGTFEQQDKSEHEPDYERDDD